METLEIKLNNKWRNVTRLQGETVWIHLVGSREACKLKAEKFKAKNQWPVNVNESAKEPGKWFCWSFRESFLEWGMRK